MKIKTSITLSESLLKTIDQFSDDYKNRSLFLETAAWAFIQHLQRTGRNARDLEIINRHADALNTEALDVLTYQIPL
ncbi:MAG: ribbon-helix-helix domain-containing protein [Chloroflexota bacterium]|nr:ribbon-helix-helix domain-containing protein [Chloroflexota bacterium]